MDPHLPRQTHHEGARRGKGNPEGFVAPVTPGRILFEAEGVPLAIAQEALRLGAQKLPITTKFIVRRDYVETTI